MPSSLLPHFIQKYWRKNVIWAPTIKQVKNHSPVSLRSRLPISWRCSGGSTGIPGPFMHYWIKILNTGSLPGVTWVTKDLVWVCTGVRLVVTTAEAVTDVTARTPCVEAMVTSSVDAAGAAAARGWLWTTWAVAVPPEVCKGTQTLLLHPRAPHTDMEPSGNGPGRL